MVTDNTNTKKAGKLANNESESIKKESPWDRWRNENKEKHTYIKYLDEVGLPEFWVKYWVPKEVTPAELANLEQEASVKQNQWIRIVVERHYKKVFAPEAALTPEEKLIKDLQDKNNEEKAPSRVEELISVGADGIMFIRDWNITHPVTDKVLPVPTTDDLDAAARILEVLPLPILYEIRKGAEEAGREVVPLEMRESLSSRIWQAMAEMRQAGQEILSSYSNTDTQKDS